MLKALSTSITYVLKQRRICPAQMPVSLLHLIGLIKSRYTVVSANDIVSIAQAAATGLLFLFLHNVTLTVLVKGFVRLVPTLNSDLKLL